MNTQIVITLPASEVIHLFVVVLAISGMLSAFVIAMLVLILLEEKKSEPGALEAEAAWNIHNEP